MVLSRRKTYSEKSNNGSCRNYFKWLFQFLLCEKQKFNYYFRLKSLKSRVNLLQYLTKGF